MYPSVTSANFFRMSVLIFDSRCQACRSDPLAPRLLFVP
jgi:hypothetical protein